MKLPPLTRLLLGDFPETETGVWSCGNPNKPSVGKPHTKHCKRECKSKERAVKCCKANRDGKVCNVKDELDESACTSKKPDTCKLEEGGEDSECFGLASSQPSSTAYQI